MVDINEAPPGCYAVESPNNSCSVTNGLSGKTRCVFWDSSRVCAKNGNVSCTSANRKDGESVIFLVGPAATTASTVPATHTFQAAQRQKDLQDVEAELENIIDGKYAPAGMVAIPAADGCQGCFYLKGKADCVRTSSVSCTALGRPDESNVIFVPR